MLYRAKERKQCPRKREASADAAEEETVMQKKMSGHHPVAGLRVWMENEGDLRTMQVGVRQTGNALTSRREMISRRPVKMMTCGRGTGEQFSEHCHESPPE